MTSLIKKERGWGSRAGMEMVQVAILIAIAIAAGLIFRGRIVSFVNEIFGGLSANQFM